jgi:hypothetical protein
METDMKARHSPLQATIVTPDGALPIKAFGLDLKILLTTEATGGAISVSWETTNSAKGRLTTFTSAKTRYSSSSTAPMS